jgi:hypothetical protein
MNFILIYRKKCYFSPDSLFIAFLKQFSRNKIIWPFLAFFNPEENSIFLSLFWQNVNKIYNILWKSKNYFINLEKFYLEIWPLFSLFSHLGMWPFLKMLMAKFGIFIFWDLATLVCVCKKESERESFGVGEVE